MQRLKFQLTSECPVILHNGQTADPLNRFSKEIKKISSKRGKTDADFEAIAKLEWYASLYVDNGRICIPSEVFEACLINGAKKKKLGKQAQAGLFVADNLILEFDGSTMTIDELWERDENRFTKGAKVSQSKVMRTRFWTKEWKATAEILYDPGMLNPGEVAEVVQLAGTVVGVCDWRPKFGRFISQQVS